MRPALLLWLLLAPRASAALPLYQTSAAGTGAEEVEEVEEVQRALCSLRTEQGQLAAHASVSRQLVGACRAREVREQLRFVQATLLAELRALRGDVRQLARRGGPVVFKYI